MKINLNDEVKFTVTADGLALMLQQDRTLGLAPGITAVCWRHDPATHQCEGPLWSLMNLFGPTMHMGSVLRPIKDNVLELPAKRRARKS